MLHEMMKSNELTDVTLVCDDKKQFKAHKIVLSACSTVFKNRDQYGIRRNFRRHTNVRTFCLLKNEGSSHLP